MKNILITGASSGIGETVARYLSEQGYRVILVARSRDKLEQMCNELQNAICFPYDLSDLNHIESIFQFCKENEILLDGVVHSAGTADLGAVRSMNADSAQYVMNVNCMSFTQIGKFMASRKYSANESSIVAISSLATQSMSAGTAAYAMSKTALNTACCILAKELARRRIRVNAIMPGYVYAPVLRWNFDLEKLPHIQPFGFIQPEEIAYLAEFLLSDKSKLITGALIPISGGLN